MAKATVETGGLDWGDFRALEYFAIIYDIAIDEEQYNPKWCLLKAPRGPESYVRQPDKDVDADKPWASHPYLLFPDSKSPGDLPDVTIKASFDSSQLPFQGLKLPEKLRNGELTIPALKGESEDQISSLWRKLLLAKHVRANLQKNGSTPALDALDKLGLALLRAMPLLECEVGSDKSNERHQLFILKILFLNEAAACYRKHQSISLADDCLNLIKAVFKEGETPYELVALYNKAQGYLHVRDYAKTLREFEKVDKARSDQGESRYFDSEDSEHSHLYWPDQQQLFDAYVGYPCVLQYAETLLNLQRSWEAEQRLREGSDALPEPATAYQRARLHILVERIRNDRNPGAPPADWSADGLKEAANLTLQHLAVDSERALANCRLKIAGALHAVEKVKRGHAPHDAIEPSLVEFRTATEKLRNRMERATRNRSEIDQACLSWADGLSVCKELLSFALSSDAAGNYRNQVLKEVRDYFTLCTGELIARHVIRGLCIDRVYRDHADEVRKTLIENLCSIHGLSVSGAHPGRMSDGFHDLFEEIGAYLKELLDDLIEKNPSASVSQIELRSWQEQRTLLDDRPLPDIGASARHRELRAFISHGFVHQADHDVALDSAQRKAERRVWKRCKAQYRCISSGQPTPCGRVFLAKKHSFMSAKNGSNTLHHLHHLDRLVQKNRKEIDERLCKERGHDFGWHFVVLQRWNSFTPAMRASEGGGYFLFHAGDKSGNLPGPIDIGVVIDPGYGFVKNFLSEGFGVCDITAIVITHDHPDHLADVDSLVNLLVEVSKNRGGAAKKSSNVEMLLSRGAFERLNPVIESARDVFRDTVVLEPGRTNYDVADKKVLFLKACLALHRDASDLPRRGGFDSVGLIAKIRDGSKSEGKLGIPSDTKWDVHIAREFFPCDLICLHLGSIMPEKFPLAWYFDEEKTSLEVLHKKYHLYLPGVVWYLEEIRKQHRANGMPTMVILSEFGEELSGGARIDIARRLQAYTDERRREKGRRRVIVLPGDVGLSVDPMSRSIRCSCCHLEHPWSTPFHCETSGVEEQIFYVCPWCRRNLTQEERAEVFLRRQTRPLAEIKP